MSDDATLIRRYGSEGDEAAFAELVGRHVHLVWGAARRITGDGDLAQDVAQTVFTDLARKAATLPERTILSGWLHRAACHAASNAVRSNVRRVQRERLAMNLAESTGTEADPHAVETLQPLVDQALATLPDADRDALVLRFFGGRSLAQVGLALGLSDDAAQKRVSRALEKLREHFRSHGITVSAGTVAAAVSVAGAETAPATVTTGIVAATAAVATVSAASWTASLALMKTPLALAAAVALGTTAAWQSRSLSKLREENAALAAELAQARSAAEARPAPVAVDLVKDGELLRLRAKVAELTRQQKATAKSAPAVVARAAAAPEAEQAEQAEAIVEYMRRAADRVNAGKTLGLAARIYATDNQDTLPTSFEQILPTLNPNGEPTLRGDIRVDQFEFYPQPRVISEAEPQMILFRERQAEPKPGGGWMRVYVLVDGSVQQISSEARMAEIERDGTAH
jgi:RNA polymerase sigma factor (sigma-70 family)